VLLVSCPDRPGLVAATAQLLFSQGANILDLDQHTDADAGWFFQRIRFQPPDDGTTPEILERAIGALADRYGMEWRLTSEAARKRLAVFVSRADHCLWDLLLRHASGELPCEIPLVVSNHADLRPVADQFGIPFEVVPVSPIAKPAAEARHRPVR
jgi:formyltetrahydrofolate deformylase